MHECHRQRTRVEKEEEITATKSEKQEKKEIIIKQQKASHSNNIACNDMFSDGGFGNIILCGSPRCSF